MYIQEEEEKNDSMNLRIKNGIHKLKGIEEEEEEKLRTIGELLSRGDETSMLDSSS